MGAACRPEPAHAVRQPRRGEPHLGVAKPRADARLLILDGLAGPLLETPADRQRVRDPERIKVAFPKIEP
jgi:hypothetical protein